MAVVDTRFLYLTQSQAGTSQSNYTAHYHVETDAAEDQCITVRGALPALGSALAFGNDSSGAVAIEYGSITPLDWKAHRRVWSAEVNYSTQMPPGFKGGAISLDSHPSEEPPDIDYQGETIQIGVDRDINGDKILNGAGDPLDGLEQDWARGVLTIVVNKRTAAMDHATEDATQNTVNDAAFFEKPVGTWKCESVGKKLVYYGDGDNYYRCSYMFRYDSRGWQLHESNKGTRDIHHNLPPDASGMKYGGEVALLATGEFWTAGAFSYIDADIYESANFGINLQIPITYPT